MPLPRFSFTAVFTDRPPPVLTRDGASFTNADGTIPDAMSHTETMAIRLRIELHGELYQRDG